MLSFIRYCVFRSETVSGFRSVIFCIKVWSKPPRAASIHLMVGLISPYKSQVQYILGLIKRNVSFKPFRRLITVHTVDGFQGQERDVIMISLVRANDKGRIGFLGDLRRMNVAITRARMKLMILGDAPTLTRHVFYKEVYEYIRENGQVVDVHPLPPP